jgi:hypothetical protein
MSDTSNAPTPVITHTYPNGAVNASLTLTFTTGGPRIAHAIADELTAQLIILAGTLHVPALTEGTDTDD